MGDKVFLIMDRGAARYLRLVGNDENSGEYFSDCYQNEVMPAVRAALDRDPDALVEQVARAIASQDRRNYTDGFERDFNLPDDYTDAEWERELKARKEPARALARAALAAITGEGGPE